MFGSSRRNVVVQDSIAVLKRQVDGIGAALICTVRRRDSAELDIPFATVDRKDSYPPTIGPAPTIIGARVSAAQARGSYSARQVVADFWSPATVSGPPLLLVQGVA